MSEWKVRKVIDFFKSVYRIYFLRYSEVNISAIGDRYVARDAYIMEIENDDFIMFMWIKRRISFMILYYHMFLALWS